MNESLIFFKKLHIKQAILKKQALPTLSLLFYAPLPLLITPVQ